MTLDAVTERLDISDEHAKDLARDGRIKGRFKKVTTVERRRTNGRMQERAITRTVWTFDGASVRAYAKARG